MKQIKGFTFSICIGRYAGFYTYNKTGTFRICLGIIALTISPYDFEASCEDYVAELEQNLKDIESDLLKLNRN